MTELKAGNHPKPDTLAAMEARIAASVEHCLKVIEAYTDQPFGELAGVEHGSDQSGAEGTK